MTLTTLTDAVAALSLARTNEDVQRIVRTAARRLTGSDGATFVLMDRGHCFYVDEDAIGPLWKGQRFPVEACICGWSMLHRRAVAIEDISVDPRIPHDAYRPTFVKSLLVVPIRTADPIGAIGIYWAHAHRPTPREITLAQALADSTAVALEHVRTVAESGRTPLLAETDPLTGVADRRAFDEVLDDTLATHAGSVVVVLLDLDHFKAYNDRHGHPAGDRLLRETVAAWQGALRKGDLLARYGGEEFALVLHACDVNRATLVVERLRRLVPAGETTSVGVAAWDGHEDAQSLVARADAALYAAKRAGRDRVSVA